MDAAAQHLASLRGATLLLATCAALEGDARPAAGERLRELIGGDLAHLLLTALAPSRGGRTHDVG